MPIFNSSSGSGEVLAKSISQTSHGFAVGDWVCLTGAVYTLTDSDLATNSDSVGVVSQLVDSNNFNIVHSGYVSGLTGLVAGSRYYLSGTAGQITTAPPSVNVKAVLIADSATSGWVQQYALNGNSQALTSGRVLALLDLASTTHINTDPGTKIPFTGTVYTKGMTVNAGSIIPSLSGRYRADWLCMSASTEFLADGIFHVVQNGVSVGQVSYNMNEASAVNQCAGFIDVDLVAGQEVSLNYRTRHTTTDGVSWDRGSYFQLTQLPTAVAPVVNTVAEYGEVVQPSSIAFSATTDTDVMSFTLPSAGVWEVTYNVISQINASVNGRAAWISDNSNVVIANSGSSAVANVSGINAFLPLTQTARITTTGATTYKVRFRADTGGTLRANVTDAVSSASSILQNKVVYTKIAGQLPSTGQTVDYVNVYRTSDISVAGQTAIVFNTILSGNIPYNTSNGQFTLTAGKTYKLTGNVNLNQANAALFTAWYNVTSGAYISPGARVSNGSSTTYGTNQVEIVFTPTVTTIVELRNNLGSASTVAGAAIGTVNGVASQATIVQLGSSNITVTDNVALFGENNGITAGQTTTSTTFVDVSGGSFNLPSAGVWEVEYSVFTNNTTSGAGTGVQIANSAGVAVANSFSSMAEASGGGTTGSNYGKVRIITSSAETYKLQWKVSGGTATLYNNSTDTQAGGSSKVSWNLIAGNVPSIGQSVDLGYYVKPFSNATLGDISGFVSQLGTISTDGTVFNLEAGKVYELFANLDARDLDSGNVVEVNWVNSLDVPLLGSISARVEDHGVTSTDLGRTLSISLLYSPSINEAVKLKVVNLTGVLNIGGNVVIKQIGSTALVGVPTANGGVVFGNGNAQTQDPTNLFYDDTNNRLSVGNSAPTSKIHVTGDGNSSPNNSGLRLENNGTLGRQYMLSSRSDGGVTRCAISDETAGAERISLGINGFTGFGEINPQARLHLKGDGNGSADNVAIRFQSDGGSGRTWNVGTRGDGGTQRFYISDETGAAERFGIDSSGRTWVGQGAGPQLIPGYGNAGLNVISIAGSDGMNIKGPGANNAVNIYNPTNGDTTLISFITDDGGTGEKGRIRYNSSDLIGGNVIQYITTSDQRLKTDTGKEAKGLEDLLKLKVRNYNWKSGSNAEGFFAQELREIVPSAVSVGNDELDDNGNLKNPWGVDYGKLTPILVKAVQELSAKVEELAKRIEELEK
jgi:hypothetical protein